MPTPAQRKRAEKLLAQWNVQMDLAVMYNVHGPSKYSRKADELERQIKSLGYEIVSGMLAERK